MTKDTAALRSRVEKARELLEFLEGVDPLGFRGNWDLWLDPSNPSRRAAAEEFFAWLSENGERLWSEHEANIRQARRELEEAIAAAS